MLWNDRRAGSLAGARIGQTDDRDFVDVRMLPEVVLHLLWRDVLPVANDDVLLAPGHDQVVAVHPAAEIAGAVVALVIEHGRFILCMQIADQHLRAARSYFTFVGPAARGIAQLHLGNGYAPIRFGGVREVLAIGHADVVTGTSVDP